MENEQINKKNNKSNTIKISLIVILAILLGILTTTFYFKQSINNQSKLKNETIRYLSENHSKNEIETTLKTNFDKLNQNDCTEIIDLYIKGTYAMATQSAIDDQLGNLLQSSMDSNKKFNFEKIEDTEAKELCYYLLDQNVIPRFVNGNLFFDVNYQYFYDTYSQYLNPDFNEVLLLFEEEKTVDYYSPEYDSMNIEVVESRLNKAYELIQKYPDTPVRKSLDGYKEFYQKVYLGAYAQDYVFSDSTKINEELLNHYKSLNIKDPELREFLKKISKKYEESERTRTIEIFNMIKNYCKIKD